MTRSQDEEAKPNDLEPGVPGGAADKDQERDAEIVRDLDAEGQADEVRGGMCDCSIRPSERAR